MAAGPPNRLSLGQVPSCVVPRQGGGGRCPFGGVWGPRGAVVASYPQPPRRRTRYSLGLARPSCVSCPQSRSRRRPPAASSSVRRFPGRPGPRAEGRADLFLDPPSPLPRAGGGPGRQSRAAGVHFLGGAVWRSGRTRGSGRAMDPRGSALALQQSSPVSAIRRVCVRVWVGEVRPPGAGPRARPA